MGGRTLKKSSKAYDMKNFDKYVKESKELVWGSDMVIPEKTESTSPKVVQNNRHDMMADIETIFYENLERDKIEGNKRPAIVKGQKLGDPNRLTEL